MNRTSTLFIACALVSFGCKADDDAGAPSLGAGNYAISTTIFGEDTSTSLLAVTGDPSEPGELDTDQALELGGTAALFGQQGGRVFAVGSSDSPVITRYRLSSDNVLEEDGDPVSLESFGITSGFKRPELVPFVSESKAYWLDDTSMQAVVWDPAAMEPIGMISLEDAARDGMELQLGEAAVRDGYVFATASYYDADTEEDAGVAVVLVIDTERDELVEVLTDDRCGLVEELLQTADGTIYLATDTFGASLHALQRPAGYPEPCLLRINAGERAIDAEFYVSLRDVAGGNDAGGLVQGADGRAYVLALHEDLLDAPIDDDTDIYAPYEATAWRWWSFELASGEGGEVVDGLPTLSGANRLLRAGGKEYIANIDWEAQRTTLLVPTDEGGLEPGLEMAGFPYGLVQLR